MNQPIEILLSKLEKVSGRHGQYTARCPSHEDRSPSLSIAEGDDGSVLVHCFAGCDVHQVVSSVGLELSDLFPPDLSRRRYERRPMKNYRAIVHNARHATTLVMVYASEIEKRLPELSEVLNLDERDCIIFRNVLSDLRELLGD